MKGCGVRRDERCEGREKHRRVRGRKFGRDARGVGHLWRCHSPNRRLFHPRERVRCSSSAPPRSRPRFCLPPPCSPLGNLIDSAASSAAAAAAIATLEIGTPDGSTSPPLPPGTPTSAPSFGPLSRFCSSLVQSATHLIIYRLSLPLSHPLPRSRVRTSEGGRIYCIYF